MKTILIGILYRDGGNWKSYEDFYFSNKKEIDFGEIQELIQPIMDEPIMVQDYGIPSIAPYDNEFIFTQGDDHSFCEIVDLDEVYTEVKPIGDINDVLELIIDPDKSSEKERLREAKEGIKNNLNYLNKYKS